MSKFIFIDMITPVEIAAYISAGALSASKLLSMAQPLWNKLPRAVAVVLPVVVAALPQIASAAGLVKTNHDFATFAVVAVAALLPGLAEKK